MQAACTRQDNVATLASVLYPAAFAVLHLGPRPHVVEVLSAWFPREAGRRLLMETSLEVRGKHLSSGMVCVVRQDLLPTPHAGHQLGACVVRQSGSDEVRRTVAMMWPRCSATVLSLKLFDTSDLGPCAIRRVAGAMPTGGFEVVGAGPRKAPCYYTRGIKASKGVQCGLCRAPYASLLLFAASSCCTAPPEISPR